SPHTHQIVEVADGLGELDSKPRGSASAGAGVHDLANRPVAVLALAPEHSVQVEIWGQVVRARNGPRLTNDVRRDEIGGRHNTLQRVDPGAGDERRKVSRRAGL